MRYIIDLMPIFAAFIDGAPAVMRPSLQSARAALLPPLADAMQRARAAAVPVDEVRLARVLGGAVGDDLARVDARLQSIRAADLAIAVGALAGDANALRAFDDVTRTVRARLRHLEGSGVLDDAIQRVTTRLLTQDADQPPRLGAYRGEGPLAGYVQVAVTREALALRPKDTLDDGDSILRLMDASDDPEMRVLKERYRSELKVAFVDVMAALTPGDRLLLRQSLVDGLSIDVLAQLHGVHRATAARRLSTLRDEVGESVRAELRARLAVSEETLLSILRMVRSRVDLSLQTVLS